MVDARDLKSLDQKSCGFDSRLAHHSLFFMKQQKKHNTPKHYGSAFLDWLTEKWYLARYRNVRFLQRRLVSARFQTAAGPVRVIGAYFPNGQAVDSEKYVYKLGWIASLQAWIAQLRREEPDTGVILAGDFNIAPADADVHDPAVWADGILVSGPERQALQGLPGLMLPPADDETTRSAWHLFVVRHPQRDRLAALLAEHGIQTLIHYPTPVHHQGLGPDQAFFFGRADHAHLGHGVVGLQRAGDLGRPTTPWPR